MFYDNFVRLCNSKGKAPSTVVSEIGLNRASATGWKKGGRPSDATLQKLADYFGVEVEDLTGFLKPAESRYACEKLTRLMDDEDKPFGALMIPMDVDRAIRCGTYRFDRDTLQQFANAAGLPIESFLFNGIKKAPPDTVSDDEGLSDPLDAQLMSYVRQMTHDQKELLLAQMKTLKEMQEAQPSENQ